jgi:hypothetical protein
MEKKHKHLIEMLAAIDPAIYLQVYTFFYNIRSSSF